MRRIIVLTLALILVAFAVQAQQRVLIKTNMGDIMLELDEQKAPLSVKNFLAYAASGYYNGTIFHRVIKDFMIQGGGFDSKKKKKQTNAAIKNEADNGLKNLRGTIAMARTNAVNSATSQFFINHKDNAFLDHRGKRNFGYAVFGKVVAGMDVVDKIAQVPVRNQGGPFASLPTHQIEIKDVVKIKAAEKAKQK